MASQWVHVSRLVEYDLAYDSSEKRLFWGFF
jgi:hypothetical protein